MPREFVREADGKTTILHAEATVAVLSDNDLATVPFVMDAHTLRWLVLVAGPAALTQMEADA